ncbi:unnamed protein product [Strongylus vulgaris]|uniref:Trehalase n=1 Tax=Strongylus vulgaris TaxID=40348 RepID=A0A3P7M060_STRVU|nr:unnamed protein product [Strongylus vulgaris]
MATSWLSMTYQSFIRTHAMFEKYNAAQKMATSWLSMTYQSFIRTHAMFEKYNVTTLTEELSAGGGGEYEVQVRPKIM